jgi:heme A synthase
MLGPLVHASIKCSLFFSTSVIIQSKAPLDGATAESSHVVAILVSLDSWLGVMSLKYSVPGNVASASTSVYCTANKNES